MEWGEFAIFLNIEVCEGTNVMVGFLIAKCESCDALVFDEIDNRDPEHVICKGCGAKLTPLTEPAPTMN